MSYFTRLCGVPRGKNRTIAFSCTETGLRFHQETAADQFEAVKGIPGETTSKQGPVHLDNSACFDAAVLESLRVDQTFLVEVEALFPWLQADFLKYGFFQVGNQKTLSVGQAYFQLLVVGSLNDQR